MKLFALLPLVCACLGRPAEPLVNGTELAFTPTPAATTSLCFPHRWVVQAGSCASSAVTRSHAGGWDQLYQRRLVARVDVPEIVGT